MRLNRCLIPVACLLIVHASDVCAVNDIGGTLITLTNSTTAPNGAWSWFEDERAIIDDSDPNNTKLLVSSVSSASNGSAESGDVDLLWLNVDTGQQGEFELSDRLERDDHNSAALWQRPDGRYVASYGKHNTDQLMRWRVSTNPGDPTSWSAEQSLDASPGSSSGFTYSNLHYLPDDDNGNGRLYNFSRTVNFDPNVLTSSDLGQSWSYRGKLLTQGGGGDRPYLRYFSDGDKIHFIATEEHPRDFNNSIYHGYLKDGQLFNSNGSLADSNIFNSLGVSPTNLTTVQAANEVINGVAIERAWTIDVAIESDGDPVAVFSGRANGNANDHRFYYATFESGNWQVNELAKAGGFLYAREDDYTGLVSIDPNDPSTLFMSSEIDPRTDEPLDHYEIFRGHTNDQGATWNWDPITFNSTMDNLRPLVPEWNDQETALVWMRGNYSTFTSWDSEVVAITDFAPITFSVNGDFNDDQLVDVLDYQFLLRQLNQTFVGITPAESYQLGDMTGDLATDFEDLVAFRDAYDSFNSIGAFESLVHSLAIPEPASWILFAIAITIIQGRTRN